MQSTISRIRVSTHVQQNSLTSPKIKSIKMKIQTKQHTILPFSVTQLQ